MQVLCADAPIEVEYVPAGHFMQVVLPTVGEYNPASQDVQVAFDGEPD